MSNDESVPLDFGEIAWAFGELYRRGRVTITRGGMDYEVRADAINYPEQDDAWGLSRTSLAVVLGLDLQ